MFGPGPDTQSIWDKLKRINPSVKIKGNWENFLVNAIEKSKPIPNSIDSIEKYVINNLEDPSEVCKIISKWPLHQEKTINGVKIGLSHNLPNNNSGDSLSIRSEGMDLVSLFKNERFDLDIAIYAHIHHPTMRYIDLNCLDGNTPNYDYSKADERLILNIGSVGIPFDKPTRLYKERRVEYLLLEVGTIGDIYPVFKRVTYDNAREFERTIKSNLPFKEDYIKSFEL